MLRILVPTCLVIAVFTSGAMAQTPAPPQTTASAPSSNQGAFDKLSPGNQKIVQALFDAEQNNATSTTTKPLSRDDIAAMKQDGKGWGEVFKKMKAQGLVQEKNLGQVVRQESGKAGLKAPSGTSITTGSGRTFVAGAKGKPEHAGAGQNGNGQRPQFSGDQGSRASGASMGHSGPGGPGGRGKH